MAQNNTQLTILTAFTGGLSLQVPGALYARTFPTGAYVILPNDDGTISVSNATGLGNFMIFNGVFSNYSPDGSSAFASNDDFYAFLLANLY
jgi:hypothetical protein